MIARIACAGMASLLAARPATAQEQPAATVQRPKYQVMRFNEDWSCLAGTPASARTDFWDAIKYVPLSDDGSAWASFGGHTRLRLEHWENFSFGPANDETFLLWRVFLHGDFHLGKNLRVYAEGKSAQSTERDLPGGHRALDVDSLDLEQLFADFRIAPGDDWSLTVRPGRQALLFGRQRLVSPLDWSNTLRRWDGVSAILRSGEWTVHGFLTQFAPVQKYDFNDPDAQTAFFGAYATGPLWDSGASLDLYFLGLDKDDQITFNGTSGPEERYTLGGRLFGRLGASGFDYDIEGAYQFGEVGDGDVDAFMIGSEVGLRLNEVWATPRFFAGLDVGSGDEEPGGDVETFNQLFALGHAFLGYIDTVGRQNVIDVTGGISIEPMKPMTVSLAGHVFWRYSDQDALYDAGGAVVRAGSLGDSREIGQEIDLTLEYRFDAHVKGLFGWSHFFPGDFIDESGPGADIDFLYAQVQYTF